ncbi:hypothetical protein F4859DRAFT_455878 [Xylaria cf. heliscus]|nr:hypothetical protein F4859DRAFT_455878 [Xylaria cf. heliscus]
MNQNRRVECVCVCMFAAGMCLCWCLCWCLCRCRRRRRSTWYYALYLCHVRVSTDCADIPHMRTIIWPRHVLPHAGFNTGHTVEADGWLVQCADDCARGGTNYTAMAMVSESIKASNQQRARASIGCQTWVSLSPVSTVERGKGSLRTGQDRRKTGTTK